MSKFKGTNGKWEVLITDVVDSHLDIAINSELSDCVAWVYSASDYKDVNGLANALLISKAPEMLEMLNRISNDKLWGTDEDFKELKQLIKQATEL